MSREGSQYEKTTSWSTSHVRWVGSCWFKNPQYITNGKACSSPIMCWLLCQAQPQIFHVIRQKSSIDQHHRVDAQSNSSTQGTFNIRCPFSILSLPHQPTEWFLKNVILCQQWNYFD
ncbi:hypothetical protein ACJMK2_039517 [Sinanodonta woodiana]|uniref:Uncharacterized protein n=1 Tax=Sinanodonta woodiana TaxID=1069815 RepID=A0ABD3WC98_SINWO